jgi:hypothetical protein
VPGQDEELIDDEERDVDLDEPTVDVVVANVAVAEPLHLSGVRASWDPRTLPRRIEPFTWFARGSRGWSGTHVVLTAYVLDERGKIVARSLGCYLPELRPQRAWSCVGASGGPMVLKPGGYDVVFALNDRPVAMWPMDAAVKVDKELELRRPLRRPKP